MTPDDKRRLAEMPQMVGPGPETDTAAGTIRFLRRLLDEAIAERDAAMAALRDLERTFDLRWKADMRAIERWRAEDPERRTLTMPDRADLVVWLLERIDALSPPNVL